MAARLLPAASPLNLVAPVGDADRPASVTTLAYNADGLTSMVQDPKLHWVSVSYNAVSAGSASLLVTLTTPTDNPMVNEQRLLMVDPKGRITQDQDEAGVLTRWTYNAVGQVISVRRAPAQPTSEAQLRAFRGTNLVRLPGGPGPPRHVTELSALQQRILALLELPADTYSRLSFDS